MSQILPLVIFKWFKKFLSFYPKSSSLYIKHSLFPLQNVIYFSAFHKWTWHFSIVSLPNVTHIRGLIYLYTPKYYRKKRSFSHLSMFSVASSNYNKILQKFYIVYIKHFYINNITLFVVKEKYLLIINLNIDWFSLT